MAAAPEFKALARRGTCRSCRRRRLLDQSSHLCGICHISQASLYTARQGQSLPSDQSTAIVHVDNRAMERMQLYSDFVSDTHRASNTEEKSRVMTISYLTELQSTEVRSPMLTTAIEALSFAHAGSARQDQRLTHASRSAYGQALTALRKVIESPQQTHKTAGKPAYWEVLATVMLMSIVDATLNSAAGSPDGEKAWLAHFWGAQQYLSTLGPSLDLEHVVSRVMTFSIYQSVILMGLAWRRPIDLKASQWTDARGSDNEDVNSSQPWGVLEMQQRFQIFSPIAALLSETDKLIEGPGASSLPELRSLWQRLEASRKRVAQCVDESLRHVISVSPAEATFDFTIEEHCVLSATSAFGTILSFDELNAGVYYSCTVMILLIVDCTLLRLRHFKSHVTTFLADRTGETIEKDALGLAINLCQCVHYFSKLDSLAYAHFMVLTLTFARNVFETQGVSRELGWCQTCLVACNARLQRIREGRWPTLCRIGDLPPGITQAGLYRTPWDKDNSPRPGCPIKALPAADTAAEVG